MKRTISRKTAQSYSIKAKQGDAIAQYNLGLCYYYGEGVEKDKNTALYWYKKALEHQDDLTDNQIIVARAMTESLEKNTLFMVFLI
jgi:TPR repeat protein